MAEPDYLVQIALTATPLAALSTVVWTDITDYVFSAEHSTGRTHERNPIQAGTFTCLVDNLDGRFDPMNSTGAYWPNLKPMMRIRWSCTWGGITKHWFTGYVDSFSVKRFNPHVSHVEIRATDGFKLLNLLNLIDPYEAAVMAASPRMFYRFKEAGGVDSQALADSSGNGRSGTLWNRRQTINGKEEGYAFLDSASAPGGRLVEFWDQALGQPPEAEYAGYGLAPEGAAGGTGNFSISFLYRRDLTNGSINGSLLAQCERFVFSDAGDQLSIQETEYLDGSLGLVLRVIRSGVDLLNLGVAMGHFEGGVFIPARRGTQGLDQIVITRSGTTFTVHVMPGNPPYAAAFAVSGTASANPSFASRKIWIGTSSAHSYIFGVFYTFPGQFAELATYPTVLTSAQRDAIWATLQRWRGDRPGTRISSVLNQVGMASADFDIEFGDTPLAAYEGVTESALAHIQAAANTDDGIFFFAGDGRATFYGRRHLSTATRSTVVQAVFGDGGGTEVAYEANGLDPAMTETDLYNEVIAQRNGGVPQKASNAASIAANGRRVLSESGLIAESDNDMLARAQFKADLYSEPVGRVRSMTFSRDDSDATFYPVARDLQLWDRVTYRQRLRSSAMWEQNSIVEGIKRGYNASTRRLEVTVHLSSLPASIAEGTYWILNTSTLNFSTVLAY